LDILIFSPDTLAQSLSNDYTSKDVIKLKNQFKYLCSYLGEKGLSAKTILIEEDYINRDFLYDYTSYYALCFEDYPKKCKRIHFFDKEYGIGDIEKLILLSNSQKDSIWSHYLGYIVVKPIPFTVIGFTILKTFDYKEQVVEREYWGIRDYSIHLFGNEITIRSLAFQEQDSVLAACATTAIWSMLHKAAVDHNSILKTPSQITKDAGDISSDGSRLFPNKGLDILQICQAIFKSGLVSEIYQGDYFIRDKEGNVIDRVVSNSKLNEYLNAYSPIGVPIILVVNVPNSNTYGLHAISVSGFTKKAKAPSNLDLSKLSSLSETIEKFYAHDDQHGPFVRIDFKGEICINSPWTQVDPKHSDTYVKNIIIPLYPKIRISYEEILVLVYGIDRIFKSFFQKILKYNLDWDIKLEFSTKFKNEIKNLPIEDKRKLELLNKSYPKYVWIAKCFISNQLIFIFTFDATDVKNGMIGIDVIHFLDESLSKLVKSYLVTNISSIKILFRHSSNTKYYNFLKDNL
jgi:hypothetical protein